MSNKKEGIIFIISILFLLSINITLAEFSTVLDKESISLCPRDTQLFADKVKNAGSLAEFTVNTVGSAAVWTTSVPSGFVLNKDEEQIIYTYITPKLNTYPATYDLSVKISSNGIAKEIKHSVVVRDCHILTVDIKDNTRSLCPNDVAKYEFVIKNNGEYQESYDLSVSGAISNWVTLSESTIILNSGESKIIYAYVRADKDAVGNYELNLNVKSKVSKSVESAKAIINVNACYNFASNSQDNFANICEHTIQKIPLQIENKGTVENSYKLSVDGPLWANLDKTNIDLKAGGKEIVNLVLSPDYKVEGDFKIDVTTLPIKGFSKSINTYNAHIRKCHSVRVDFPSGDKLCNLVENGYNIIIKNDGEYKKDYKIEMNAPSWITLNTNDTFSLNPNQTRILNIYAKPGYNVEAGDYSAKIRISSMDDSKVEANGELKISIISRKECYLPKISVENKDIEMYYDSSNVIPISIENGGWYSTTYEITLGGSASSFIRLNPSTIRLDSGKSKTIYAYVAPSAQIEPGIYTANIGVRLVDSTVLASETLNIQISPTEVAVTNDINKLNKISFWDRVIGQVKNGYEYLKTKVVILNKVEKENVVNKSMININSVKNSATKEIASKALNKAWLYKNYILLGVILLLVIVIVLNLTLFRKKIRKRNGRR